MRVLLLGAGGFIGRELFAALTRRGHRVVPAVRDASRAPPFAEESSIVIDMNHDVEASTWLPRLAGIDAVVNCAGVLQGTRSQSIEAIHREAPIALFDACVRAGVRRVVQVSAISAERAAGTAYALTKLAADDHLRASALDWVVVRPSLVHARGAYGGTAAMRAIAAFPFAIPVPGGGTQRFQPVHVDDVARVVAIALEEDRLLRTTVDPVGPDTLTLREILVDYRRWLGLGVAPAIAVPRALVNAATWLADRFGGPLNSTAAAQMEHGNTGDYEAFHRATGIDALRWREALAAHPAHAQDRWHARLYFVRPLLRWMLAILWIASGFAGLDGLREWTPLFAAALGVPLVVAGLALVTACIFDVALAVLLVRRWNPRRLAAIQVAAIALYTAIATLLWPSLWLESLGPLLKNLPIVAAVLALGAIEEER
jgi:uncharacterized protein YbjT (DUF2867 family)/uncharacterized membrane protein YphA (DoxX/SURF4 family)